VTAHEIVVARVHAAVLALVDEVNARPEDDFRRVSLGSDRYGEVHHVLRRGDELVRVSIEVYGVWR
jgi:hypothetical protein